VHPERDRRRREHTGELAATDHPDPGKRHAALTVGEPTGVRLGSTIVTPPGGTGSTKGSTKGVRGAVDVFYRELLKFGVVGVAAFIVDVGVYNLLVYGGGTGPLHDKPLTASAVSVSASVVVAWLGSRYWTFRHRRSAPVHHELALFVLFNLIGLLITMACLGVSRYVLHEEGWLADNIAKTLIGTGLATVFRFWAYRKFVFKELQEPADG
jgi:putative flippase GtrA